MQELFLIDQSLKCWWSLCSFHS